MFKQLQQKWKVTSWSLVLILITFAVGGSLTGYTGKRLMELTRVERTAVYIPLYIIVMTLVWPLMVLAISIPLGQFQFFKRYITNMGRGIAGKRKATANAKHRLAVFASGTGTNAQKIIDYFRNSSLINVALIVCNKPGAGVVNLAAAEKLPVLLIEKEPFFRGDGYVPQLQKEGIDFIALAGFLWKIPQTLIHAYPKRIINIHPALLPRYGGKGMYGHAVHTAVLQAGDVTSGITIHYVDEHYDKGAIIFQQECAVEKEDTPETLASRIHRLEHAYYPKVIEEVVMSLK